MYKKFKKVFLIMSILGTIFINVYSNEIKEVQLIDDFSAELLGEKAKVDSDITKIPVKEVEENEDIKEKQEEEYLDNNKVIESKNKHKIEEIKSDKEKIHKQEELKKQSSDTRKKAIEKNVKIKEKKVEDKNLEIEEVEDSNNDNLKYETIKHYSTDGVEWELPNNFRAIVVGDTKGNIIFEKNSNIMYPLASVTKMMSLMVTFDEINSGKISLNDRVRISKTPLKYGGSGIPLKAGQKFILEDLIKASAVYSANNATYAIAEYVGKGSIFRFVVKMNKKLKMYGLQNEIKYHTPAGLPTRVTKQAMDEGTARGIYKLSIEALKYKKYIQIAGIKATKIYGGKISIKNRNHLIGENGVYGIKTGFHKEAKYNIAVASKFEGKDIIIVVMGGESYKTRDRVVLRALDILNNNYTVKNGLIKRK